MRGLYEDSHDTQCTPSQEYDVRRPPASTLETDWSIAWRLEMGLYIVVKTDFDLNLLQS